MTNQKPPLKETIYIESDDEITSIVHQVRNSKSKILALVLPKRTSALQSAVNMKLLKRTGDQAKKRIVLITSEPNLIAIAGLADMFVARTLTSKPYIPSLSGDEAPEGEIDATKPVGELAELSDDEAIEVDNEDKPAASQASAVSAAKKPGNKKSGKKLKIPNFDTTRKKLALAAGILLLLILILFWAFRIAPRATITLLTDTTSTVADINFVADPSADEVDQDGQIVPAQLKEFRQTESETVETSGERNEGDRATGSITISTTCNDIRSNYSDFPTIASGTVISAGNRRYETQQSITLGQSCPFFGNSDVVEDVEVRANGPGERFNLSSGQEFSVAGHPSLNATNGQRISGGTDDIVQFVTQDDVNRARDRIVDNVPSDVRERMRSELADEGFVPIDETFKTGDTAVTAEPNIDRPGREVTVNVTITYTMVGVSQAGLVDLVEAEAAQDIDQERQMIIDNGSDNFAFRVLSQADGGRSEINVQTVVTAGPRIDEESLRQDAAGRSRGEVVRSLEARPGIREAEIAYSPFWVFSTPSNPDKISIVFKTNDISDTETDDNSDRDESQDGDD